MFANESHFVASRPTQSGRVEFNSLTTHLMDLIECGLIVCDAKGTLIHANRAARRELAQAQFIKLVGNDVRRAKETQCDLQRALEEATKEQKTRLLILGGGADRLAIVTMPLSLERLETPSAIVMIGQRTLCSPLAIEMIAIRHALTCCERRVFRALLANQSPREIAKSHSVSLPTVRTQIQSIRDKVGVRSVDELLLFAAQVPPVGARCESHMA